MRAVVIRIRRKVHRHHHVDKALRSLCHAFVCIVCPMFPINTRIQQKVTSRGLCMQSQKALLTQLAHHKQVRVPA
jgi:hypothetical protein